MDDDGGGDDGGETLFITFFSFLPSFLPPPSPAFSGAKNPGRESIKSGKGHPFQPHKDPLLEWMAGVRDLAMGVQIYSAVREKVTVLLSASLARPAWAGCSRAELFSQPGTNLFAQSCTARGKVVGDEDGLKLPLPLLCRDKRKCPLDLTK